VFACRPPSTLGTSNGEWASGVFEFTIRDGSTTVVGMLQSRGGTMTVTPRDGSCYKDTMARPDPEAVLFTCDGVSDRLHQVKLRIDPWDPPARSRWSATVRALVPQIECTAYGVDSRGNRICIASRTITVESEGTTGGTIVMKVISVASGERAPARITARVR
jgi:hypothetical protein